MDKKTSGRRLTAALKRVNRWWWSVLVMFPVLTVGIPEVEQMIGQAMALPFHGREHGKVGQGGTAPLLVPAAVPRKEVTAEPDTRTKELSHGAEVQPSRPVYRPESRARSTLKMSKEPDADRNPVLEPADNWNTTY
jgi:hypothetical protein